MKEVFIIIKPRERDGEFQLQHLKTLTKYGEYECDLSAGDGFRNKALIKKKMRDGVCRKNELGNRGCHSFHKFIFLNIFKSGIYKNDRWFNLVQHVAPPKQLCLKIRLSDSRPTSSTANLSVLKLRQSLVSAVTACP